MSEDKNKLLPLRRLGPTGGRASSAPRRRGSNPVVSSGRWAVSHPWALLGLAGAVWFCFWVVGTRSEPHHVKAAFPTAFNLAPGQDVKVDGVDAGKVSAVEYKDGRSIVELGISEEYWPLPQGTTASTRYGTTIGSGTRRVDLQLGPKDAPKIAEDGIIPAKDTRAAVDVDAVLNTASSATREDATSLSRNLERATAGTEEEANASIGATGKGLKDIDGFLKDLGSDSVALSGLITNTDRLTRTLAARAPAVSDLVSVSAGTFAAFASRTSEIQQTLDGVQPAMAETRQTLARVDQSLGGLTALIDDIEPGAKRLKPLARSATPALRNLSSIVPAGLSTVKTTTRVAPELNTLLTNGQPFLQKTSRVLNEITPIVHCLAPYAPEIGGAAINAAGGYSEYFNAKTVLPKMPDQPYPFKQRRYNGVPRVHDLRARVQASTNTLHAYPPGLLTVKQYIDLGLKQYAYMRPPGLAANQPKFYPECGYTKDLLDPSKDPEEKFYDPARANDPTERTK